MSPDILAEARRRRTFAIISHPDAGKTTLTEKFLLYAGAIEEAGAVKARRGQREAHSDWMEMERQRGISITSTAISFVHRGHRLNLLDTPGHRDFSEDTYRVLSAVDAALMVLDAAKGVEPQTLKLFEVCRTRGIPLLTFVNKCDRPAEPPLGMLDEIERALGVRPTPVTWPVGEGAGFRGVLDRRDGRLVRFQRTARGATEAPEESLDPGELRAPEEKVALDEVGVLDAVGADVDRTSFLAEESTPVFFGSALWNFGVRHVLDAVVDLAPAPEPRPDRHGDRRALETPFSGQVFKVQANMDPHHRDRIAFVRVCSGRFERGMSATIARTGRPFAMTYAHELFGRDRQTLDVAYPGDVVGLVNARELRVGDSLYEGEPVEFPPIPTFAPELFRVARNRDTARYKQFRRGLAQLEEEGVIQILRHPDRGDQAPVLAAVGEMQYEVLTSRLDREFGASVDLTALQYSVARRTDEQGAARLAARGRVEVLRRTDGALLALFPNEFWLEQVRKDEPDLVLDPILET